jgi:hypothetical protein
MVVVAVVIALGAVAIITLRSSTHGSGPLGFARQILSELEDMRLRAMGTRRWQRLVIDSQEVRHEESTTTGMALPGAWNTVRSLIPNQLVQVCGVEAVLRTDPGGSGCQGSVPAEIVFAPDGTVRDSAGAYGSAATIYVDSTEATDSTTQQYRITMYRATGMALLFEGF